MPVHLQAREAQGLDFMLCSKNFQLKKLAANLMAVLTGSNILSKRFGTNFLESKLIIK